MVLSRISTGLPGLDSLIEGGIPRGFTVLFAGNPGTGKTILSAHFLHEGLKRGENGLYVSFSESKEQFLDNTERLGMDFIGYQSKQDFVYLDFASITREGMRDAIDEVLATIRERKIKRIVVDSFSAISQAYDTIIDARIVLQTILGKMMRAEGVTTVLISEVPFGQQNIGSGIEEFVADGIIRVMHGNDNSAPLMLNVVKMRGTLVNREPHVYTIGRNGGVVYPKQSVKLTYEASRTRVTTGIPRLDSQIAGGFLKGTTTALLGAAGVGKTTFAFQFIAEGVRNGEPGIYLSLEESVDEIRRMAEGYGYDVKALEKEGLTIISKNAEEHHPDAIAVELTELIEKTKAKRLVFDSLTSFQHVHKKDMFIITKRLSSLAREHEITTIFTCLVEQQSGLSLTELGFSSIFQNIILLRYFEFEGNVKRSMILLKMRATHTDNSILGFSISSGSPSRTGGIVIEGTLSDYSGVLSGNALRLRRDFEAKESRILQQSADRKSRLAAFREKEKAIVHNQAQERKRERTDFENQLRREGDNVRSKQSNKQNKRATQGRQREGSTR